MKKFLKIIFKFFYKIIPLKKYVFIMLKKVYQPSKNIYQHLVFKGNFQLSYYDKKIKIYNTGTLIENQLFWRGIEGYEPNSLKIWAKLSKTSDVVFDLGANTGVYSLLAFSQNPSSEVYSFEPVERNFKVLKKNVSMNNFNINCYNLAISNREGTSFFIDDYEEFTSSVVVNKGLEEIAHDRGVEEESLRRIEVEITTLDSFIKLNNIKKIDLMKIDVETHEPQVFEGFNATLEKYKPTFLIEIIRDHVASYLERRLSGLGYIFFHINDHLETREEKKKSIVRHSKLVGRPTGNYLICENYIVQKLDL